MEKASIARLPLLTHDRLQLSKQLADIHGQVSQTKNQAAAMVVVIHLLFSPPVEAGIEQLEAIVDALIAGFQCSRFPMPDMKSSATMTSRLLEYICIGLLYILYLCIA